MTLPFNLPKHTIPYPEESEGDKNPTPFSVPHIPSNAPPELITLATNMSEILTNLSSTRGEDYTVKALFFTTALSNLFQLEEIACSSTKLIRDAHPDDEFRVIADSKHATTHLLAESMKNNLSRMLTWVAAMPEYSGLEKDVISMLDRIDTDFISRVFNSNNPSSGA